MIAVHAAKLESQEFELLMVCQELQSRKAVIVQIQSFERQPVEPRFQLLAIDLGVDAG